VDFWVQGQPGLQSEFQDSQGYTEEPCLEKPKKKKKKKKKKILFSIIIKLITLCAVLNALFCVLLSICGNSVLIRTRLALMWWPRKTSPSGRKWSQHSNCWALKSMFVMIILRWLPVGTKVPLKAACSDLCALCLPTIGLLSTQSYCTFTLSTCWVILGSPTSYPPVSSSVTSLDGWRRLQVGLHRDQGFAIVDHHSKMD
jgi:hypothetical protein